MKSLNRISLPSSGGGRPGRRFAITLRLVLSGVFLIMLATLLLYSSISWRDQKRSLLHQIDQQSQYLSGLTDDFLSGVAYGIAAIARSVDPPDRFEHAQAMWTALQASHPEVDSLLLTDRDGRIIYNSAGVREDRSRRLLRELFELESRGERFHLGVPRYDDNYENPEVGISHVSRDRSGAPLWRVEAKVKLERLTYRWRVELLPPGAKVMLLHQNGYVVAEGGTGNPDFTEHFADLTTAMQAARGDSASAQLIELPEAKMFLAFHPLQRQNATILIALPEAAIWHQWLENNRVLFIAFALAIVIYGGFAVLLMRRERVHSRLLLQRANVDPLTGMPNRAAAEYHLRRRILQAQRERSHFGVLYIDLDDFKGINDTYGHQCGDHLLVELTLRLSSVLRAGDMLARLGGDEYMAVVNCSSVEDLTVICRRLLDSVQQPFTVGKTRHKMTLSIGGSYYPIDGVTAEELLKRADMAMYAVKRGGRNGYRLFNVQVAREARTQIESGTITEQI